MLAGVWVCHIFSILHHRLESALKTFRLFCCFLWCFATHPTDDVEKEKVFVSFFSIMEIQRRGRNWWNFFVRFSSRNSVTNFSNNLETRSSSCQLFFVVLRDNRASLCENKDEIEKFNLGNQRMCGGGRVFEMFSVIQLPFLLSINRICCEHTVSGDWTRQSRSQIYFVYNFPFRTLLSQQNRSIFALVLFMLCSTHSSVRYIFVVNIACEREMSQKKI